MSDDLMSGSGLQDRGCIRRAGMCGCTTLLRTICRISDVGSPEVRLGSPLVLTR
jgi:hypothetical protein